MTESEAYLQLALILGILFSIPLLWRVGRLLGKVIMRYIFPPKYINIKIKKLNGHIEQRKVKIDDSQALIHALLEASKSK